MRSVAEVLARRWAEVDVLLAEVLGAAPGERQALLTSRTRGDPELLATVQSLLESAETSTLPDGPGDALLAAALGDSSDAGTAELALGTKLGSYRLVRLIARGGMAAVFEAERSDGAFDRRVAIKILEGIRHHEVADRFRAERQILSSLDHPNIARLLDGGTTPAGQPFLVMELVDGEPVTRWADRRRLDVSARIELFEQVAEAVWHAHQHLVVHRDLKPSNVLVRHDDEDVKLLDFGIAKILQTDTAEEVTLGVTRWMTPRYAAPEQILGRPVTTATDVHGLGVLLYELLTGSHPFAGEDRSGFEVERAICEDSPPAPSLVVRDPEAAEARGLSAHQLRHRLSGDLDAIVLKALRKDPTDRYLSVQALLEDLERFRRRFPVRARDGLWSYRAARFTGRHRVGVGVGAAVLALALASAAVLLVQRSALARERDRVAEEAQNSDMVVDFLADVFRGREREQAPGDTVTARELVEWGVERVRSEFSDRPVVQARLYGVMGDAFQNLGLLDEATAAYEEGIATAREAFGPRSPEAAGLLLQKSEVLVFARRFDEALPLREDAFRIYGELGSGFESEAVLALVGVGVTLRDVGLPDSAETVLLRARALADAGGHDGVALASELGLAFVYRGQGRLQEAEALYAAAIPRARQDPSVDPLSLGGHLNNFGFALRTRGDLLGADTIYAEALEVLTAAVGRAHPVSLQTAANRAGTLQLLGRGDDAVAVLRENISAAEARWPEGHWRVGSAYRSYGSALLRNNRADASVEPLRNAARIYEEILGPDHPWTVYAALQHQIGLIAAAGDAEARAAVDRFKVDFERYHRQMGGTIPGEVVNRLIPVIYDLEAVGLAEDGAFFRALLPGDTSIQPPP